MTRPLTITNADVWNGKAFERRDLYMTDVLLDKPARSAITVDLSGYTIFPGMINAHDHLELNYYPRTKYRARYDNAHQWGEDVNKRLNDEPFKTLRSYPLEARLFIGGLKNLLCGATTVVHHNPPHKALFRKDFPVRVLKRYGWMHSLHFNTDQEVVASYRKTPPDVPWFIHLAEGTDEIAAGEYQRLKKLGCVGLNTVIVHGVGMTDADITDAAPRVRALVWCPSTNSFLLGKTANVSRWIEHNGKCFIGSDSRLTADGDLQLELLAAKHELYNQQVIESPFELTGVLVGLPNTGHLNQDALADWFISPIGAGRHNTPLLVRGGVPQIGDPELMTRFTHIQTVRAELDGVPKAINIDLARQIARCSLKEPGLELIDFPGERKRGLW